MSSDQNQDPNFIKLKKSIFFCNLPDDVLKELLSYCEEITLEANKILFRQNDPSDSIYIVISGYLLALLTDHFNHLHTMGGIKSGELIGEMGLLSNKPRSLTIKALIRSKLLKLSQESFYKFIKDVNNHELFVQITKSIIQRQQSTLSFLSNKEIKNHILLIKINNEVNDKEFIGRFSSLIHKDKRFHFCDINTLNHLIENEDYSSLINYIDDIEKDYQTIFYYAESLLDVPSVILHRIDNIVVMADGNKRPYVSNEYIKFISDKYFIKQCLVLLWPPGIDILGTINWLHLTKHQFHYHIILDKEKDYERLLRILTNEGIGLVLSGGGARVWFHLGVIRAITEKNIPIDAVCGTSSGAGVAACLLTTENFDELFQVVQKISIVVRKAVKWYSVTLPVVSFYNGNKITHYIHELFGSQTIEDLRLPYLAVSTNVNTGLEYLFIRGPVWEAIRASSAIPGVFPPFVKDGNLLLDGGMTNNLPIDHMVKMLHGKGTIIASDNSAFVPDKHIYQFPPSLTFSDIVLDKLRIKRKGYLFPSFLDMILKAMLSGSGDKYRKNLQYATHYIKADLSLFHMFLFDPELQRRLYMLGYIQGSTVLDKLQNKK